MGKRTREPQLERWRYAMLFRVTVSGEEPVIVPAYDEADAVEQAAEELGMDPGPGAASVRQEQAADPQDAGRVRGLRAPRVPGLLPDGRRHGRGQRLGRGLYADQGQGQGRGIGPADGVRYGQIRAAIPV